MRELCVRLVRHSREDGNPDHEWYVKPLLDSCIRENDVVVCVLEGKNDERWDGEETG